MSINVNGLKPLLCKKARMASLTKTQCHAFIEGELPILMTKAYRVNEDRAKVRKAPS